MIRKSLFASLFLLLTAAGAALGYAPYLPRLISEGYPAKIWPAAGSFAEIQGASNPLPVSAGAPTRRAGPLPEDLASLLLDGGAKAFLVERSGRIELEQYADGAGPESRFNSFSMAKSLVGTLMLKAQAEGRIADLDQTIGSILPDIGDDALRRVSLRALLTMQGGVLFHRDDPLADGDKDLEAVAMNPFGPMARLHSGGLEAIGPGLTAEPALADRFRYQNVNTAILGAALETLYGTSLAEILSEKLWHPAGARSAFWRRYRDGGPVTPYCCIFATAQDWIKVGRYLMQNGTPTAPFLPDGLWRQLMATDIEPASRAKGAYGLHVRHDILDRPGEPLHGAFTYLLGQGGQILYLLPEEDMIVLRFGDRMQRLHSTLYAAGRAIALR